MGKGDTVTGGINKGIPREELDWAEFILGGGEGDEWEEAPFDEDGAWTDEDEEQWEGLYKARSGVLRSVVPKGATPASLLPDAPSGDVQPLIDRAEDILDAMDDMSTRELVEVSRDIGQLSLDLSFLQIAAQRLRARMDRQAGRLAEINAPEDATQKEANDLDRLITGAQKALDPLPLTEDIVLTAESKVAGVASKLDTIVKAITARAALIRAVRDLVPEGATDKTLVPDAPDHELDPILKAANRLLDDIAKAEASDLSALRDEVGELKEDLNRVAEATRLLREQNDGFGQDLAKLTPPEDALEEERKRLVPLIEAAQKKLELRPFLETSVKEAGEAVQLAAKEHQKIVEAAAERLKANKALCSRLGIPKEDVDAYATALGGHDALADVIKVFGVDTFDGISTAFGGQMVAAGKIKDMLADYGGAAGFKTAMAELGGADKMAALMDKGHKSAAEIKSILTGLGPGFAGELMGSGNDPADAITLFDAFGTDIADFTKMAADSGLATQPKALLALLKGPCKGNPSTFKAFCESFKEGEDRENLKGLMTDAGLGNAPDAMAALFTDSFGADPAQIKALAKAMTDDDARKGLNAMLSDGGLDGQATGVDTDVLAKLAQHISGDKPSGTSDADFAATRAGDLAKMAKAFKDPGPAAKLKAALTDGGLGKDAEVFAHLIGMGCDKGDATKTTTLLNTLGADAQTLTAFKDMLQKGGLGTVDDAGAGTGVDAKCLGTLLQTGCNGKPAEMVKLAKALGDTTANPGALANLKTVMKDGELGKHPKVFGKVYEHGCLNDPGGAHDSAKNPKVLIDMVGEFSGQGALFKNMLTGSGFTDGGQEDRLGSVLRHAFTPKPPAAQVQDAKSLRKLANSFNGNFADLKTTMEAMEAAPGHVLEPSAANAPNQPGKGLGNVIHAPRYAGDPTALHNAFFVPLTGRAAGANSAAENNWYALTPCPTPARLSEQELLYTAASFEFRPMSGAMQAMGPPLNVDIDMDHCAGRHSRVHCVFHTNNAPKMGTTLYPRDFDETAIKNLVVQSFGGHPAAQTRLGAVGARTDNGQPKATPPQDTYDMSGGGFTKVNVVDDTTATNPERSRAGFALNAGTVYLRQFYPRDSAPPNQAVNNNDYLTMNNVLRPDTDRRALY